MKTTEKYICNGSTFTSYENAVEYCAQNNYRITNTKTLKMGVYLLTVTSITPQNHLYTTTEITRIIDELKKEHTLGVTYSQFYVEVTEGETLVLKFASKYLGMWAIETPTNSSVYIKLINSKNKTNEKRKK